MYLWRADSFLFTAIEFPIDETCTYADLGNGVEWLGITVDSGEPSAGSCVAQGGLPQGGVEAEAQVTFCCT